VSLENKCVYLFHVSPENECKYSYHVSLENGCVYSLHVYLENECVYSFHVSVKIVFHLGNAWVGKRSGGRKRREDAASVLQTHSSHVLFLVSIHKETLLT